MAVRFQEATALDHRRPKAAKAEKPREIAGEAVEMEPRSVELNTSEEGVNVERYFHGRKCPASPSLHDSVQNELLSFIEAFYITNLPNTYFTNKKQLKSRHVEFR